MDHSTRMLKTLAALAVAMTGAAALLDKIDPSPVNAAPALDAYVLAQIAGVLVSEVTTIDYQRWQRVEVALRTNPSSTGLLLVATSTQRDAHFVIDGSGRPFRDDAWRSQRNMPDRQGTIRIVVAIDDPASPVSWAQQRSVDALVTALTDILRPQGGFLPIGYVDANVEPTGPST